MPHNLIYEFGPYRLDSGKRVLTRTGETISLTPKSTDILIILVTNAGELVGKDELIREVWPDTFVEEANLTQNIFRLRKALDDGPRYIQTVTRRGYRFLGQVRTNEIQPSGAEVKKLDGSVLPIVAVLPFVNNTNDEELEYIVDGLTDNIINNLSCVSKLRVMSHSAVFRYKAGEVDPQTAGKEFGASAVLVGQISVQRSGFAVAVELVDVATGWQLWGKTFDSESKDLLEIQSVITRQVLATLKLELTGAEEKRVTARYTENAEAYQAYLEGRYHWSRYTKKGIEKAIKHFRLAIEIDPNYALAYAGIVDCYLRLATNYLPPDEKNFHRRDGVAREARSQRYSESTSKVKLRFEWDWKSAEREVRRAHELKTNYPAAHQWHAAFILSQRLLHETLLSTKSTQEKKKRKRNPRTPTLPKHIASLELTPNEQVRIYCTIAREQIEAGNYDAGCMILKSWWQFGNWPKLQELDQYSCADLLFTAGELAGCVASTKQIPKGQKHAEALLSGSIALWEQLGSKIRAAEGRIELALCYYREGMFDLGRTTLISVLDELSHEHDDLRSLALIRLASLERHAGRLHDALSRLTEASEIVTLSGPWATGRCHLEFASTYKHLSLSYDKYDYFYSSEELYLKALYEFEAVGNHRLVAIVENNLGYLLLMMGRYSEAESHLLRARRSFDWFKDMIRRAQAEDSLAQLYLARQQFDEAEAIIECAVQTMERGDEDALLAEALTTKGKIYSRSQRYAEAKRAFEDAYRLASRCGDQEGAGRALLALMEEMPDALNVEERKTFVAQLVKLLSSSQQPSILRRLRTSLQRLAE